MTLHKPSLLIGLVLGVLLCLTVQDYLLTRTRAKVVLDHVNKQITDQLIVDQKIADQQRQQQQMAQRPQPQPRPVPAQKG